MGRLTLSALVICGALSPGGAALVLGLEPPAIVFVSRDLPPASDPDQRDGAIERASSGRLLVREGDDVEVLVDASDPVLGPGTILDVMDPDVSFDGTRIVFAGFAAPPENAWRIFEINADGSGLRQITRSDRDIDLARYGEAGPLFESYDDVDPCYLPDGRVCFVSTRYPGVAPDGRLRATNLYVVNSDGTDLHRITSERFGADTPTVEPSTGRIVYSRWWRSGQVNIEPRQAEDRDSEPPPIPPGSPGYGAIASASDSTEPAVRGVIPEDFPGVNSWFLAGIDPDGSHLAMHSGFRVDRESTQAYRPSFLPDGDVLALFIPKTPFIGFPGLRGLRRFKKGPGEPAALGGPQVFHSPNSATHFFFASAVALPDGRYLVSAAPASQVAPDFDLFIQQKNLHDDGQEALEPLFALAGTAELDAVPLVSRPVPPILPDRLTDRLRDEAPRSVAEAFEEGGRFTFAAENIFFNGPVDFDTAGAPPAGKKLAIEFYMNPQRSSPSIADVPLLIHRVDVPASGKVEVELPGGVPLFEVLRLPNEDFPLGRDGQIFHVAGMNFGRAGESAKCVGCHAGHTLLDVPEDPTWINLAPSAEVRASSFLRTQGREPSPHFQPGNLVDRSTEPRLGEWAARESGKASVELSWSARIHAREVVIHGPAAGEGALGIRDQRIRSFHILTSSGGVVQEELTIDREVVPEGTAVALDTTKEFDTLALTIGPEDVSGLYEGQEGPALAEIVVMGQVAGEPRGSFSRADTDCDGRVNLGDAVLILDHLFRGVSALCCKAAADADGSAHIDLSDSVYLLEFLFDSGSAPPPPFGRCGPGKKDGLGCDQEVCPSTEPRVFCEADGGFRCMPDELSVAILGTGNSNESLFEYADFVRGMRIDTQVVLDTTTAGVQGWAYGVAHDSHFLTLIESSVTTEGTRAETASGPARFEQSVATEGGYISAVVLSLIGEAVLPLGRNPLCNASYTLVSDPGAAGTKIRFASGELGLPGSPPVELNFTVNGESMLPHRIIDGLVRAKRIRPSFMRGDMNGDGRINLTDPLLVLRVLVSGVARPFDCDAASDIDNDGEVNLTDAVVLLDWLFRQGSPPADPFLTCGTESGGGPPCREASPACE